MSDTVRVTLDLDRVWLNQFMAFDDDGQLVFQPDVCTIVSIEEV